MYTFAPPVSPRCDAPRPTKYFHAHVCASLVGTSTKALLRQRKGDKGRNQQVGLVTPTPLTQSSSQRAEYNDVESPIAAASAAAQDDCAQFSPCCMFMLMRENHRCVVIHYFDQRSSNLVRFSVVWSGGMGAVRWESDATMHADRWSCVHAP